MLKSADISSFLILWAEEKVRIKPILRDCDSSSRYTNDRETLTTPASQ